jgi:hypothetical protein
MDAWGNGTGGGKLRQHLSSVSTMRDAQLNWPARVAGVIAAELGVEPHLLQTILQQHINELLTEASDRFDPPGIGGEREPHA